MIVISNTCLQDTDSNAHLYLQDYELQTSYTSETTDIQCTKFSNSPRIVKQQDPKKYTVACQTSSFVSIIKFVC